MLTNIPVARVWKMAMLSSASGLPRQVMETCARWVKRLRQPYFLPACAYTQTERGQRLRQFMEPPPMPFVWCRLAWIWLGFTEWWKLGPYTGAPVADDAAPEAANA